MTTFSKSATARSDAEDRVPKLKVWHATYSHLQNVATHKTYYILDRSRTYNKKMAACTNRYAKRVKTLKKAYKFDEKNPIIILRLLAQFRRACNSNKVPKGTTIWNMPTFTKDEFVSSLTV